MLHVSHLVSAVLKRLVRQRGVPLQGHAPWHAPRVTLGMVPSCNMRGSSHQPWRLRSKQAPTLCAASHVSPGARGPNRLPLIRRQLGSQAALL